MKKRIPAQLLALSCLLLSGCINILPPLNFGVKELNDAKALMRVLTRLSPEAKELVLLERNVANQLKITLEEVSVGDPVTFRAKLREFHSRLVEIRDRRVQIRATIAQGTPTSPLVFAVQLDAMRALKDDINQTERWLQSATNVQMRADLGQTKVFPELLVLGKQIDAFLAATAEEPLADQIQALREEFRIGGED